MSVSVPSFAKINLGLRIGALRPDGFHELRTVYQTIALHDTVRVAVGRGSGIEIRSNDPRVPCDATNTCYKIVERAMHALKARGRVTIEIEKRLPVQGGLGGASGNAVATLLALERALKKCLPGAERLRIAADVGSDLPLFLIGGTVLGVGRGEEVYPLTELPSTPCVIALPEIAVSTPKAFEEWDHMCGADKREKKRVSRLGNHSQANDSTSRGMRELKDELENRDILVDDPKLTSPAHSDRMLMFSREFSAWLSASPGGIRRRRSGVSTRSGGRAENPLLDLVRTGIENDFERVVFPQYPELLKVKRVLERAGALYASLSGSGSAIYGLFESRRSAEAAAGKLVQAGTRALVTTTLTRRQYWKKLLAVSS